MATYIDNTINEKLDLDDTIVSGQIVSAPDDVIRKYGIIQEVMQESENTDVLLEAKRKIQENSIPKESLELQCLGDLNYRVGWGVVVDIPQVDSLQRFMYVKSVKNKWQVNGDFTSTLSLTKSRVMDTQEWQSETDDDDDDSGSSVTNSELWNKIYGVLKQQIGKPYVYGTCGANTFDCSGLVYYCYNQFADEIGFRLGRDTYSQIKQGEAVDASNQSEWQEGDLVFPHAGHVVVYTGNGKCIEAWQTGTNVMEHDYSRMKTYAVRRVIPEISGGFTSDKFDGSSTNIPNGLLSEIKGNVTSMISSTIPNISGFKDTLLKVSKKFSVDKYLLLAIITCESNGNMNTGSTYYGLCQVSADLASEFGYDRYTAEGNMSICCCYYNQMYEMFAGNRPVALTAYNCGQGGATIKEVKALGKSWKDVSLNDIYTHATNTESREYAGRVLLARQMLKEKKALE